MSQRQSLTQGVGHTQTVKEQQRAIQIQKQKNEQLQDQQFEAEIEELEDMQDDEVVPVADAPEIHDVDTSGDSDAFVEPEGASSPFELEWVGPLPRVRDLPSPFDGSSLSDQILCR